MLCKLVGLDPSLSNWGVSLATYDTDTGLLDIHSGFVIQTKPSKSKQTKNTQDLERAYKLYQGLFYSINQADVCIAELPTGSQSARAMTSYGVCLGIIGSLIHLNPNFFTYNPNQIKKCVGKKDASKDEVIDWVIQQYPSITSWLPKAKNKAEHICDSIVALHLFISQPNIKEKLMKIVLTQQELEQMVTEELGNQGIDLTGKTVEMTFLEGAEIDINSSEKPTKRKRKPKQTEQEIEPEVEVEAEIETQTQASVFDIQDTEDPFADVTSTTDDDADDDSLFG